MAIPELVLREGLEQPRPLTQIAATLADGRLQHTLPPPGPVVLQTGHWPISRSELAAIAALLAAEGLELQGLGSTDPHTRVAAAGLGLNWQPSAMPSALPAGEPAAAQRQDIDQKPGCGLRLHQGTLRAGDQLEAEGSVLVLGDVNPGARVRARGHVLVWGTLRGVAHAGCQGDTSARIVALQLRPLQLRIAAAVARGPEDLPTPGCAEQAELIDGVIQIKPAAPQWPLA